MPSEHPHTSTGDECSFQLREARMDERIREEDGDIPLFPLFFLCHQLQTCAISRGHVHSCLVVVCMHWVLLPVGVISAGAEGGKKNKMVDIF